MAFEQPDRENTFSEFLGLFGDIQLGAFIIGLVSIAMLVAWSKWKSLKQLFIPAPGRGAVGCRDQPVVPALGDPWLIKPSHLVQVPVADNMAEFFTLLPSSDFLRWTNPAVYAAAATIAEVSSLETLLNLQAVDKIEQVLVICYEVLITPLVSMK